MQSGASAGLVRGQELKEQLLRKQQVGALSASPAWGCRRHPPGHFWG